MIAPSPVDFWNTLTPTASTSRSTATGGAWARLASALPGVGMDAIREGIEAVRADWYATGGRWAHAGPTGDGVCFAGPSAGISTAPPSTAVLEALQEAALHVAPRPIDGVLEAIRASRSGPPLGIISDTGFTPGRVLREVLRRDGVLDHFSAMNLERTRRDDQTPPAGLPERPRGARRKARRERALRRPRRHRRRRRQGRGDEGRPLTPRAAPGPRGAPAPMPSSPT